MEAFDPKTTQVITSWIASLATSVVCCSVLFVIFAGYLNDIKRSISAENMELVRMTLYQEQLLSEVQSLRHAVDSSQTSFKIAPSKPSR